MTSESRTLSVTDEDADSCYSGQPESANPVMDAFEAVSEVPIA